MANNGKLHFLMMIRFRNLGVKLGKFLICGKGGQFFVGYRFNIAKLMKSLTFIRRNQYDYETYCGYAFLRSL
jgi:hypothetical protein